MHKKSKLFIEKSRAQRKLAYIQLKNQINSQNNKGNHFVIGYREQLSDNCLWEDIYFLSKKNGYLYNVTVDVSEHALKEENHYIAFQQAFNELPLEIRAQMHIDNNHNISTINGKTFEERIQEHELSLLHTNPIVPYDKFELLPDFFNGIGLNMWINTSYLTDSIINNAIEQFWSLGEKNWSNEKNKSIVTN